MCALCDIRDQEKADAALNPASPPTHPESLLKKVLSQSMDELKQALEAEPIQEIDSDVWVPRVQTKDEIESRARKDLVSGLLGEKMLQGWTLLNDDCPNTDCFAVNNSFIHIIDKIPLVANKKKERFCVNCKHFVKYTKDGSNSSEVIPKPILTEKTLDYKSAEITMKSPTVINMVTEVQPSRIEERPLLIEKVIKRIEVQDPKTPLLIKKQKVDFSKFMQSKPFEPESEKSGDVVSDSLNTLEIKLAQLNEELRKSDMSNIKNVSRLCQTMTQCAIAIQTMRTMM